MDNKLIAVFALLNACVIMSIALPLPPYQRTQSASRLGKLFPKEHDFFRNRDDSKPYSWDGLDSEKLSLSGERASKVGKTFGENSKQDTGEKEIELQLLRDIVASEEKRLADFRRAQEHTNEKRQRCLPGYLYCELTRDAEKKTGGFPVDKTLLNNGNGILMAEPQDAQQHERQELERMLRELDAKVKARDGIFTRKFRPVRQTI